MEDNECRLLFEKLDYYVGVCKLEVDRKQGFENVYLLRKKRE